jgi:hypothetical protein
VSIRQRFLTSAAALAVCMAAGCANSRQGCCSRPAPPPAPPCCPEAGAPIVPMPPPSVAPVPGSTYYGQAPCYDTPRS